jgi:hypothetical protein
MTLSKWIALASAAAMIAGVGACKNNPNDTGNRNSATQSSGSASPQGRRGDTLPRRDMNAPTTPGTPSSSPSTSSGSSSDTSSAPSTPSSPGSSPSDTSNSPSSSGSSSSNPSGGSTR